LWPAPLARAIRWIAGASFTLYLTHLPIILALCAIFPALKATVAGQWIIALVAIICAFLLAELGERRKRWYRGLVIRMLPARSPR
jgi:peptidoglycan/LPS O-acetylase OafA/YrhL